VEILPSKVDLVPASCGGANSVGEEEVKNSDKYTGRSKDKEMKRQKEKRRYYNSAFAFVRHFAD
jgi:hypothetical protein